MLLAAFFVEPDPETAVLPVNVRDSHAERGTDSRKDENQQADHRAVAQANKRRFFCFSSGLTRLSGDRDAVQQLAGLFGREHGRLAFFHDVLGAAHGMSGVDVQDVADDQPVEQHAQRGQVLLDRGR